MIRDDMERLVVDQVAFVALKADLEGRIRKMSKRIESYIDDALASKFPGVQFTIGCMLRDGCMTSKWDMYAYVFDVGGKRFSKRYGWHGLVARQGAAGYRNESCSAPVSVAQLEHALKEISTELGVKVRFIKEDPITLPQQPTNRRVASV